MNYGKKKAAKESESENKADLKRRKESLLTKKDFMKLLQIAFNAYIRARDQGKPCISCDEILKGKYDAGHLFAAGHYPNLAVDEDNVHGQCTQCNQPKSGNQAEYMARLPDRIGKAAFEALLSRRKDALHLSIPEIKELTLYYKQKLKSLKSNNNKNQH